MELIKHATIADFPIIDDPSAEWVNGPNADGNYPGLYGRETMQKALCIDFDGVLHRYSKGWLGHDAIYDEPVEGAVQACWDLADAGWKLYVLTSRQHLEPVGKWLAAYDFPPMMLTRIKPIAVAYIDDRAVRFEDNWSSIRKMFA